MSQQCDALWESTRVVATDPLSSWDGRPGDTVYRVRCGRSGDGYECMRMPCSLPIKGRRLVAGGLRQVV
jgi:hypothetical protein